MMSKCLRIYILMVILSTNLVWATEDDPSKKWEFAGWYGGGMYPSIAADPSTPGRLFLTSDVAGIWRSENHGDQWNFVNKGLSHLHLTGIAISRSNPQIVYITTKRGMMKSYDAGENWTPLKSTYGLLSFEKYNSIRSIAVHSEESSHLFAGTTKGELFFSDTGGLKWVRIRPEEPSFKIHSPIRAIQLSKDNSKVYIATVDGLFRWDRNKNVWSKLLSEAYDFYIDKANNIFYAAMNKRVAKSVDDGNSWSYSNDIPEGSIRRLSISTDPKNGYSATILVAWEKNWMGGVSALHDISEEWEDLNQNLEHDLSQNPTREWMKGFGRPNAVLIDPHDSQTYYLTDSWGVWRSKDQGKTWQEIIKGAPNVSGSDIDISSDGHLFVATMDNGLLKSLDGGETYKALLPSTDQISGAGHFWRILLPKESQDSLITTSSPWNLKSNQVWVSGEDHHQWNPVNEGLPESYPMKGALWGKGYARAIAGHPEDANTVYLGIDGDDLGGLFVSKDAGNTWVKSLKQPESKRIYNALKVNPQAPHALYWGSCSEKGGGVPNSK